ncbi:IclR family transcriptional regulator C-terminal domain-containing protein [Streptomyces sp. NPDC001568]|uniref:IclR family transcriptional regulator domain-containing protein n=1 Tax=Streptomyces sp. NPDC001568 TaxID=3364588 RepID=UPI0036A2CCEC
MGDLPEMAASDRAGLELEALCVSVVLHPQASRDIALLVDDCGLSTAGAVAFGCLLHLAGEEAAGFWWEFAAGAGEPEAAYLLMLDHKRRVEPRDEAMWRDRLKAALEPRPHGTPSGPGWTEQPELTASLRHSLRRTARYAEVHEHDDLGNIWLPTTRLAKALMALATPTPATNPAPQGITQQISTAPTTSDSTADEQSREEVLDPVAGGPSVPPGGRTAPMGLASRRLWTPPPARRPLPGQHDGHAPAEWEDSLRILDVLQLVRESGCVDLQTVARTAGLTPQGAAGLLAWLDTNSLTRPLDNHTHGPGPLLAEIARGNSVMQLVLDQLRDDTGAAIYLSTYTDGEIVIPHLAWGPDAPQVTMTVDFKETPHASAVGKSLLSQLPPAGRADLLSRHQPKPLTRRTITDAVELINSIDRHGPQSTYFDVFEYSDMEVCVALSLPLAGQVCSVALSLPAAARHRLLEAARALSDRSIGLFLALVLATNPEPATPVLTQPSPTTQPAPEPALTPAPNQLWTPGPAPVLTPHIVHPHTRLTITTG